MTAGGYLGPLVTAPGKLFLAGEYAVLDGGEAVVAAVDCRACGQLVAGLAPASALVAQAEKVAREALGAAAATLPPGSVRVDTSAFSVGGRKLGIGSSAATAVVTVAALLEAAGVSTARDRAWLVALADRAHRAFQGGLGSGADVAAAVHGGLLAIARPDGAALSVRPLPALPAELVVFSAGDPSSTVDRVRAVMALRARAPERYAGLLQPLLDAADAFAGAVEDGDGALSILAARDAHAALEALGRAADVAIVTPIVAAAAALADELAGAAKPSGAGGGDVGVGFFPDIEAAAEFRKRAPRLGVTILDISVDDTGTHLERHHVEPRS